MIRKVIRKLYYQFSIRCFKEILLGTGIREKEYIEKPIAFSEKSLSEEWINHPSKLFLTEIISKNIPFASICEIGCNAGPNLYHLAKRFPELKLYGVDINANSVAYGNEWFKDHNINNISLLEGRADNLSIIEAKSMDIIFTNAILVVIGPDKIRKVVNELMRIASKKLIFMEWHDFQEGGSKKKGLGIYTDGFWKRDYKALLSDFVPVQNITVTKVPVNVWPDAGWKEYGAIVEVDLEKQ